MSALDVSSSFYTQKKLFFTQSKLSLSNVEELASSIKLENLFNHKDSINQEFNDLSALLDSISVEDNTEQLFYFSLYCCYLLKNYHTACNNYYQAKSYEEKATELINKLKNSTETNNNEQLNGFSEKVSETFSYAWNELKSTLLEPSKFSQKVGQINLSRIVFLLAKMSLSQLFIVLEQNNILQQLSKILSRELTSAQLISKINIFNGFCNALSVAMFGSRLLRNLAATFYFTFRPPEEAKNALPTKLSRLYHQIYERKGELINDTIWTVVNGVTNYQLFGMPALAAMGITAGFMFFDIVVLLYLKSCDEAIYRNKQEQYQKEIDELINILSEDSDGNERQALVIQLHYLQKQKLLSEINWRQTSAVYSFQTFACLTLGVGFGFSMLVAAPASVIGCYTLSILAISMVLSSKDYGKLKGIKAKLDHAETLGLDKTELQQEYNQTQCALSFDLVKNTLAPSIIIGTLLICSEAGLILMAVYMIEEGYRSYTHKKHDAPEKITHEEPAQDDNLGEDLAREGSLSVN